jgi:hypothetical protein
MKRFENYPFWIVLLSNFLSIAIYGLGFFIMYQLHWVSAMAYLLYVLALEIRLIKNHCTNCYYWGKLCGFGRGKLSSWLFKQGDATKFCNLEITWKTMIPDFLVWVLPVVVAIILLIIKFSILLLLVLLLLIVFSSIGNAFVRGSLTCKHCKQNEIGCPADKLFNK